MSPILFKTRFSEEWVLFCGFSKSKFFVAEEKSGLHKRELSKYETFPILVFEGSLSIEVAL